MPRHLITAALSGVDGVGSLGALAGSALPADAYARFLRARGERVLFVCASDEPRGQGRRLARLAEGLGLSCDALGTSSAPRAREQAQYFARRLEEEGLLEARSTRQALRSGGTGDGHELFFLQSGLAGEMREWLRERSSWPPRPRSIGLEWLDEGLRDRSLTEDLAGGVAVEREGFEGKRYCAWFDHSIACIGATREWAETRGEPGAWRDWWRASEQVRYVQFMAEDDVRGQAVSFPCMVIGSRDEWQLVDYPKAFRRFACRGDAREALELLPADCWRYYLLANAPEAEDADFSWEALAVAADEVAGGFGGFVQRSLGFADRHFGGQVPAGGEPGESELKLLADMDLLLGAYADRMAALEFRAAIAGLRAIWSRGSAYLDRKRPWCAIEADRADAELTLRFCLNLACLFARLAAPAVPFAAERVLDALGVPASGRGWPSAFGADELAPGRRFTVPPLPLRGVAEDDLERWRARSGPRRSRSR